MKNRGKFVVGWALMVLVSGAMTPILTSGPTAVAAGAQPAWQLPFENGQTWKANGPHRDEGLGSKPWGSIDFGPTGSNKRVVAVAAGKAYKISCAGGSYLGVDHGSGWRSTYYHLTNVQLGLAGKQVSAGTYLGNAGRATPCGGSAAGDHVHLTILKDGGRTNVHGFKFGGYTVREGSGSYLGSWTSSSGSKCTVPSSGFMTCSLKSTTTGKFTSTPTPKVSDTTPALAQRLSVSTGTWSPSASFSYQWLRSGAKISGATKNTYTVAAADIDHQLSVTVTGKKSGFTTVSKTSAKTTKVPPTSNGGLALRNPHSKRCVDVYSRGISFGSEVVLWDCSGAANQAWRWNPADKTLRVYGTPVRCLDVSRSRQTIRGQALSISECHGEPNQQWNLNPDGTITSPHGLCLDARAGGTANRTVIQTWTCLGSTSQQFIQALSGTVEIVGSTRVGQVAAVAESWNASVSTTFQWALDGVPVPGATEPTLHLLPQHLAKRLSVTATASLTGFPEATAVSPSLTVTKGLITLGRPTIRGKARVGGRLRAVVSGAQAGEARPALSYRWLANGKPIKKATGSTLKLLRTQVGKRITVKVTASANGFETRSQQARRTARIRR